MRVIRPTKPVDWLQLADEAAFRGGFTRAWAGDRQYAQSEALLLTPATHERLWAASRAIAAIIGRVVEWAQQSPALLALLGIPANLEPWVRRRTGGAFSLFARLDWIQDEAGRWWCLECNADTPAGLPESTTWQRLVWSAGYPEVQDPNERLLERLGASLRGALPGRAGFLTSPGYLEDWENTLAAANARGGDWVAGSIEALTAVGGRLSLLEQPIDSLYRYYPGDWLVRRPELIAALAADDGLPVVNGGAALIAQSKALFALLWHLAEERQFLTETERDWVQSFIPRTALTPLPGRWVAKPYWEREGAGLQWGEGEGAAALLHYVYQSACSIREVKLQVRQFQGERPAMGRPVLGVYLINGEPAGYYTRVGGVVTDRTAHFLPTFVNRG